MHEDGNICLVSQVHKALLQAHGIESSQWQLGFTLNFYMLSLMISLMSNLRNNVYLLHDYKHPTYLIYSKTIHIMYEYDFCHFRPLEIWGHEGYITICKNKW